MDQLAIILDTNVFVAAGFRASSASGRLLEALRAGRFRHVWHARTRAETRRILSRIPRLGWPPVADLFDARDEVPEPLDDAAFAIVPDPDDRKYAALAAVTGAWVATGDDDLLGVREDLLPIRIRRPSAILRDLEEIS